MQSRGSRESFQSEVVRPLVNKSSQAEISGFNFFAIFIDKVDIESTIEVLVEPVHVNWATKGYLAERLTFYVDASNFNQIGQWKL